jgi:phage terminase large subunit GpA-like protein
MRIEEEGAGYIHFSDKLNDEYFRQLTAEKIVTKFVRGYKKGISEDPPKERSVRLHGVQFGRI